MHIDKDHLRLPTQGMCTQNLIHGRKRIIKRAFHKHLPQDLKHQNFATPRIGKQPMPDPRRTFRIVQRANDAAVVFDGLQHFLLVERMIAQSHAVRTGSQNALRMRLR